jgi:hypothetical protein
VKGIGGGEIEGWKINGVMSIYGDHVTGLISRHFMGHIFNLYEKLNVP